MAANSKKNITVGTQWGEGQVSLDTLLPISASSFTQPAEAGSNVEVGNIPLSMTGATGAPAPESAVSQIQIPDTNVGRKGFGEMKPETQNGGDPPMVASKPTGNSSVAQLSLASEEICTDKGLVVQQDNLNSHNPDLAYLDSSEFDAIEAFFESFVFVDSDEELEGSQSLQANSPEPVTIESTQRGGGGHE
jgi:hypothetical protein